MMAKDHVTVFSSFCSDVFSHYLSSSEICCQCFLLWSNKAVLCPDLDLQNFAQALGCNAEFQIWSICSCKHYIKASQRPITGTLLGLERGWIWDLKMFGQRTIMWRSCPESMVLQPLLRYNTFLYSRCSMFCCHIFYMITVLQLWSKTIVNEFITKCIFLQWRAKCLEEMKCQHRSTIVWVDSAKMTCCKGFFFSFLTIYMLL